MAISFLKFGEFLLLFCWVYYIYLWLVPLSFFNAQDLQIRSFNIIACSCIFFSQFLSLLSKNSSVFFFSIHFDFEPWNSFFHLS
jgi:hypothetical protein